jgi:hypothetical protein
LESDELSIDNDSLSSIEDAADILEKQIPEEEDNLFFHRW